MSIAIPISVYSFPCESKLPVALKTWPPPASTEKDGTNTKINQFCKAEYNICNLPLLNMRSKIEHKNKKSFTGKRYDNIDKISIAPQQQLLRFMRPTYVARRIMYYVTLMLSFGVLSTSYR